MKSTNNKLTSLLGSIVIALTITMFLPSLASATWGNYSSYNHGSNAHGSNDHGSNAHGSKKHGSKHHGSNAHGSNNHGSNNHGSNAHGSNDCSKYETLANKYKTLADKYLAKYNSTHIYTYYKSYLCYAKKYEYFKKKFDQCQSSGTVDCDKYKVLADKYKACALKNKAYADKYLAKYNKCHWYSYYKYYLSYTKKYNYYMDLYNQYMDKYNDCQAHSIYGSVVGYIYEDTNKNEQKDAGEVGAAGVHVTLTDANGKVYADAITDATGKYTFDKVYKGAATIRVTNNGLPDGILYTINNPQTLSVEAGKENNAKNVGYTLPTPVGTLSGKVFEDSDENGVFTDGEVGASGIVITITDSEGNTQDVTSQDGTYSFSNVAEGSVDIVISSLPAGYILIDGSSLSFSADITPNQNNIAHDTGYTLPTPLGSLHGTVYADTNGNGQKDAGEIGQAGITVNITDAEGNTQTQVTDANGDYEQADLVVGTATVTVDPTTLPTNYELTAGTNPSTIVVVAEGNVDAGSDGYTIIAGDIEFYIFLDINQNGVFDSGDIGLPNVLARITDSTGRTQNVMSDTSGLVSITLPIGTTAVYVNDNDPAIGGYERTVGTSNVTFENLRDLTEAQNHGFINSFQP